MSGPLPVDVVSIFAQLDEVVKNPWILSGAALTAAAVSLWALPGLRRCLLTLPRDLRAGVLFGGVVIRLRRSQQRDKPIHHYFLQTVRAQPDKLAVIEVDSGRRITLRQLNELANKYANYFASIGYEAGDVLGLFVENSADFVALWLGLSKLGIITAWLNTNIKLEPLGHSIRSAACKCVITTNNLLPVVKEAMTAGHVDPRMSLFAVDGPAEGVTDLSTVMNKVEEPETLASLHLSSVLCYIYTSGTTDAPKPAVIKHRRFYWMCALTGPACGIRPSDVIYCVMPMYHSAAGVLGVGQMLSQGCTLVVRKRFSASSFWRDVRAFQCTASQYIGEIARYLTNQPPRPDDRDHPLRLLYGNGMRREVWTVLRDRFGVERVSEFYGSTEGNANTCNLDGTLGACGLLPVNPLFKWLLRMRVLRVEDSGCFLRDSRGLCVEAKPGEDGQLVGLIDHDDASLAQFDGYVSKTETNKKLIRDVLTKGDTAFASGDLFHWDEYGYLYFKDRLGDTFRWKGENVSTTEVEGVVQQLSCVGDLVVFGVNVPGREGRAGMAAVHLAEGADQQASLQQLADVFTRHLPTYAVPIFLRLCTDVERTGTYKLRKGPMQKSAFDPEQCGSDPLFIIDHKNRTYRLLDGHTFSQIQQGNYQGI